VKPVFFLSFDEILPKKMGPEKYDFDLYKGFSMKKNGPNMPKL